MPMFVTSASNQLFAEILERICINLQITSTQFKDAKEKYEAVGKWLGQDGSPLAKFDPHIFPQGSLNIDTTVRPLGQNEFDLDLVCKLLVYHASRDPATIFDLVWDRMYAHGTYRAIIERKRRCVRINYAGQFHLDIVPAVPDFAGADGDCILVPDIPKPHLKDWKESNPLGYARWFESRTLTTIKMSEARVDPLRRPVPVHLKPTLKRSVQLFKRWRDIRFANQPELAPPSIILTTLAAQLHEGEEWCTDALATILGKIKSMAQYGNIELYNPVNAAELISERWKDNPDSFDAFVEAIDTFHEQWLDLIHSRGVPEIGKELKALFGEPAVQAFREAAEQVGQARSNGQLHTTRSTRTLVTAPQRQADRVERNHFYGD